MLRLLQWLVFGHVHHWEIISNGHRRDGIGDVVGNFYDLQCKKCGNVKGRRT